MDLRSSDSEHVSRVKVTKVAYTSDPVLDVSGVKVKHLDGSNRVEDVLFSSKRLIRLKDTYDTLGVWKDISHLSVKDCADLRNFRVGFQRFKDIDFPKKMWSNCGTFVDVCVFTQEDPQKGEIYGMYIDMRTKAEGCGATRIASRFEVEALGNKIQSGKVNTLNFVKIG